LIPLGQAVLLRKPSQQFDHPTKGRQSSRSGEGLKEKINAIKRLQTGV
jgi:hypothetical protein